jgi:hypothetical protein
MDRQLSTAVLATFRDSDATRHRASLQTFSARRWTRSLHWLDASGLALYLLDRLQSLAIHDALPDPILNQLQQRHADNRQRTESIFGEFLRINAAFSAAQLRYVNLKGFTLAPEYCPDLSLRYQMDCDFLVDNSDAARYTEALSSLGYALIAATDKVMEFKTDVGHTPDIADLYKPRQQRSVELHLSDNQRSDLRPELIEHSRLLRFGDCSYPALSAEDMFLAQAHHIFRHVRSEWTRISWLLEFKQFIMSRRHDTGFWASIQTAIERDTDSALALAVAARLTERAVGEVPFDQPAGAIVSQMPSPVALWLECFSEDILFAEFPGSKLYLILEQVLENDGASPLRRLFPMRLPAPIVAAPVSGFFHGLRALISKSSYFFFRLRFHLFATSRYFVGFWQWKRLLKARLPKDMPYGRADCAANAAE